MMYVNPDYREEERNKMNAEIAKIAEMIDIEEIRKQIDKVENARFYLSMKDYWASGDYDADRIMRNELQALNNRLKELEENWIKGVDKNQPPCYNKEKKEYKKNESFCWSYGGIGGCGNFLSSSN